MSKWDETEYTTSIRVKPEKKEIIVKIKGEKSRAGKLDEIIDYYLKMHNIKNL